MSDTVFQMYIQAGYILVVCLVVLNIIVLLPNKMFNKIANQIEKMVHWVKKLYWILKIQFLGAEVLDVPEIYQTEDVLEMLVKSNPWNLTYIDDDKKTAKLCGIAVKANGHTISQVPKHLKSEEMLLLALKQDKTSISYIPYELRTLRIWQVMYDNYPQIYENIPIHIRSKIKT